MAVEGDEFDIQTVGLLDKQDSDQLVYLKNLKLRNRLKEQKKRLEAPNEAARLSHR